MQLKRCPECQHPAALEALVCPRCGHAYRTQFVPSPDQTQMIGGPAQAPPPTMMYAPAAPADASANAFAVASLVLGILSITFGCLWLLSLPLGITGIVLALRGLRSQQRGLATAGLVTAIIGTAWSGILGMLWIIGTVIRH